MSGAPTPRDGRAGRGRPVAVLGAVVGAGTLLVAGFAAAVAALLARRIVSPDRGPRPDDVDVLGVGTGTVTLRATTETVAPGRYGFWLDGGAGHVRVGEVLDHDRYARTVTRSVVAVDSGRLDQGPARWNQYFYSGNPATALGLPYEELTLAGEVGDLPAWFVPAATEASGGAAQRQTWAIMVHGRGASREECLRAIPLLHRLGFPSLAVTYRNDPEAAASPSGRYHLGDAEWRDVEVAVLHAVEHGASDVVLVGWSMGGAIALQLLTRSWTADRIRAVVLDAPVLDWRDVIDHHARINRVPAVVGRLSQSVLEHGQARRLAALDRPLSLNRMDWVARADELTRPILILHSDDDEFVPSGPSRRLAQARPDLVTLVSSRDAGHTREWNVDPHAWDAAVARFLLAL